MLIVDFIDLWDKKANGGGFLPLMEVKVEEVLATDNWLEKGGTDEGRTDESLTTTAPCFFCSRFSTAEFCSGTMDSSQYSFERFFVSNRTWLASSNAIYLAWNLSEMVALQIAILVFFIFNTCLNALEACLGAKLLPHHTHSHPSFPSLNVLVLVWKQSNRLLRGGNCSYSSVAASSPPQSSPSPPPPPVKSITPSLVGAVVIVETVTCIDNGIKRVLLLVWPCFLANSYAVHRLMAVDSNSSTHTTCLILWGSGSFV